MSIRVVVPTPLRRFTNEAQLIEVEAQTVREVLESVDEKHPGFRARLCEDSGQLRRFFNIYIDGEDIRFLNDLDTPLRDGAELAIIPAISGGLS